MKFSAWVDCPGNSKGIGEIRHKRIINYRYLSCIRPGLGLKVGTNTDGLMTARKVVRHLILLVSAVAVLSGLAGPLVRHAAAQESSTPQVVHIKMDGVINQVKTRYLERAMEEALETEAALLVIELDTPGGLLNSTREIVELILSSPIPTAVYVSPPGARAGSAGTFITAAAHFAVMAPGTNIGAATPVSGTGQDLEETLASKVENDAAALIRSIAEERGRNATLLEATVREAASYTAREAVDGNVVDFLADDMDQLLTLLDGRKVQTPDGESTLETEGLPLRSLEKNLLETILEFLADPNVSFLLLSIGGLGIVIELFNPGLIAPVVVGVICLILAFVALGNLPVNWAGVALILLAIVLAAAEVAVVGFGILGVASAISLVIGGLLLFAQFGDASPTLPPLSVNRWLVVGSGIVAAASVIYLARMAVKSRRERPQDSTVAIVGMSGSVTAALTPRGTVRVANDTWTAVSSDGERIEAGEPVSVVAVDGLVLSVRRMNDPHSGNAP